MRARFEKVPLEPDRSFVWQERRLARFDAPWHFHPEIELTLIVSGRGRRFVGDSIEPFSEGDLVLLGPNLPHFWHNEGRQAPGARAHAIVVQFRPDFLGGDLWSRPEFAGVHALLNRASRGIQFHGPCARAVAAELRHPPELRGAGRVLRLLAVLDALARLPGRRLLASAAYEPSLDRRAEERLARVYAHLMRHFRWQLPLAEIARVAAMNPQAFSRYFKRATGRNFSAFLTQLRLDHAGELLRSTTRTVADIAAESGFATLSSFNRRFRERMAVTPRAYRRDYAERGSVSARFVPV